MAGTPTEIDLNITIAEADGGAEQLDRLTAYLLRDLRELGVDSVERSGGGIAPEGAKAVDPVAWGALALVVAPTILPKVLEFLQAWTLRGEHHKIRIKTPAGLEIEFTPQKRMSQAEVLALAAQLTQTDS